MKKKWIKGLIFLSGGFLLFFILRFIYGFISNPDLTENQQEIYLQNSEQQSTQIRKNYASFKQKSNNLNETVVIDQKYEKKATLNSYSGHFEDDQKKIKDIITASDALVQYEDQSGLDGQRKIFLSIGVPPDNFDRIIADFKSIGRLNSIQINKNDKTNEYKELNAKVNSLIKSRDALIKLKNMQAKVEELISLEEKILDLENQIQDLGVSLGQYDQVNEFCTVDFTLAENIFKGRKIGIMHRIIIALEWTVKYYFILVFTAFIGALLLLIIFKLCEKFKIIGGILGKYEKK
jgi:hypothetical protein